MYCIKELQVLQPELKQLAEQGMDLVVIALGDRKENEQIFTRLGLKAVILHDVDYQVIDLWQVDALPQTFFIDRQGRIAASTLGWAANSYEQEFLPIVQALLAE